jgi:hypothetical protein
MIIYYVDGRVRVRTLLPLMVGWRHCAEVGEIWYMTAE